MITLYNTVSSDGYIADKDGNEDFIPDELWTEFIDLCNEHDSFLMGRKTYEAIQTYSQNLIDELETSKFKKIILTNQADYVAKTGYIIVHSIEEAMLSSKDIVIASGSSIANDVLDKKLVDKIILNIIPVKLNDGIKMFDLKSNFKQIIERDMGNGRVWREYNVQ